jgi:chromosome segregation ATPase
VADNKVAAAEAKVAERDETILDLWKKVEGCESEIIRLEGEKETLRIQAAEEVQEIRTEAETRQTGLRGRIVTLQDEVTQTREALSSAQEGAKAKDDKIRAVEAQLAESVQEAKDKDDRIRALEAQLAEFVQSSKDKDARIQILEDMDEANKVIKAKLEGELSIEKISLQNAIECMEEDGRLFDRWRPKIYQAGYDLCVERARNKVGTADLAAEVHVPPGWWGAEGRDPEFRDFGYSDSEATDSEGEDEGDEEFDDDEDVGLGLKEVAAEANQGSPSS